MNYTKEMMMSAPSVSAPKSVHAEMERLEKNVHMLQEAVVHLENRLQTVTRPMEQAIVAQSSAGPARSGCSPLTNMLSQNNDGLYKLVEDLRALHDALEV